MNSTQRLHPQFKLQVYEDGIVIATVFYRESVLGWMASVQFSSYFCLPSKSAMTQSPETVERSKAQLVVVPGFYKLSSQTVQNS